jgi:hypothetical protein
MHSLTLNRLQRAEYDAKKDSNPLLYLQRLSPIHTAWHGTSFVGRRVGFLLFHWDIIQHFKILEIESELNVNPYREADFRGNGRFAEANWDESMGTVGPSRNLDDLIAFSQQIEAWHNEAHMIIEDVTGAPMMDPSRNIYYPAFWNLHFFINQKFEQEAKNYAKSADPSLKDIDSVIRLLENEHYKIVKAI